MCSWCWKHTHTSAGVLIPFPSLPWNKSKTSYAAFSECHLCYLTATLISTIDRSQLGNCRLGPTSKLESISGQDNLFRSPIISPSLKTLWLMLARPNSISAVLLSITNSHLWKIVNGHVCCKALRLHGTDMHHSIHTEIKLFSLNVFTCWNVFLTAFNIVNQRQCNGHATCCCCCSLNNSIAITNRC